MWCFRGVQKKSKKSKIHYLKEKEKKRNLVQLYLNLSKKKQSINVRLKNIYMWILGRIMKMRNKISAVVYE